MAQTILTSEGSRLVPFDTPANAPNLFASESNNYFTQRIYLDTASTDKKIGIIGSLVWAFNASDRDAELSIRFTSQQNNAVRFKRGQCIGGFSFNNIYLTNTAQAGKWIDLWFVVEQIDIRIINPDQFATEIEVTKSTAGASIADVTITAGAASAIILAANSDRRRFTITALTTNTQEVRIGFANASAASTGTPLQAGETLSDEGTFAIYGYTAAGADQKVAISYTED